MIGTISGIAVGIVIVLSVVRIIKQYERGVKFTLGKYSGIMEPGLNIVIPLIQSYEKVDIRQRTIDLRPQDVMTKDQVNLTIDGVVFYTVEEAEKVILNVENLRSQLEDKATSELKEIIGKKTMAESLSKREEIATALLKKLNEAIKDESTGGKNKDWGIAIKAVQINNVKLPQELIRAMSKQAEAEREKEARKTKAEGEFEASQKFKDAAAVYKNNPEALRLRELQTYQEIGIEQNSLMLVIPSGMINDKIAIPLAASTLKETAKPR